MIDALAIIASGAGGLLLMACFRRVARMVLEGLGYL